MSVKSEKGRIAGSGGVLWVTPVPPARTGGGGQIRQAHLLLALAATSEVHLLSSREVPDEAVRSAVASLSELGVTERGSSPRSRARRRLWDLRVALGATPREVAAFAPAVRAMEPIVADSAAGTVVVEYGGLAPLVAHRRAGQRWILTLHNLASVMASEEAMVAPRRRQRWLYSRDAETASHWERRTVERYDRVIAVSEEDAERLGSRAVVVPNGVDPGRFRPAPLPPEPSLVFSGALYTAPNRDGITWFCREIWPLVRRQVPCATLAIVGSRPGRDVTALGTVPGVSVHADVSDVAPYLYTARVAVVPLRIGSGTRLKALEAMAAGRPVVGTATGLGGLGLSDGRHAAFADEPVQFAACVCRVLQDDQWAADLADEARRLVEERFDWREIGRRFTEVVLGGG